MDLRKLVVVGLGAASIGGAFISMPASADVAVYFNSAPPPMRHEVVPAPRHGYTWSAGYWNARGQKHTWQPGHWERDRAGYHLNQPTWTQHDNRWELQRGSWSKGDRDHDGIPNSVDRAPDNPNRS